MRSWAILFSALLCIPAASAYSSLYMTLTLSTAFITEIILLSLLVLFLLKFMYITRKAQIFTAIYFSAGLFMLNSVFSAIFYFFQVFSMAPLNQMTSNLFMLFLRLVNIMILVLILVQIHLFNKRIRTPSGHPSKQ
ncbi:MAG: hypothetical protein ACOCWQ_04450 [Nanoarchaeota archaeon]